MSPNCLFQATFLIACVMPHVGVVSRTSGMLLINRKTRSCGSDDCAEAPDKLPSCDESAAVDVGSTKGAGATQQCTTKGALQVAFSLAVLGVQLPLQALSRQG